MRPRYVVQAGILIGQSQSRMIAIPMFEFQVGVPFIVTGVWLAPDILSSDHIAELLDGSAHQKREFFIKRHSKFGSTDVGVFCTRHAIRCCAGRPPRSIVGEGIPGSGVDTAPNRIGTAPNTGSSFGDFQSLNDVRIDGVPILVWAGSKDRIVQTNSIDGHQVVITSESPDNR